MFWLKYTVCCTIDKCKFQNDPVDVVKWKFAHMKYIVLLLYQNRNINPSIQSVARLQKRKENRIKFSVLPVMSEH